MQLCDEEDDASSPLAAPKPEPNDQTLQAEGEVVFQEVSDFYFLRIFFGNNHFAGLFGSDISCLCIDWNFLFLLL